MTQDRDLLDDLRDISGWSAVASGQAQLTLGSDAGPAGEAALRLDYDFKGGGGFVVARRDLARPMPAAWAISLRVRGAAPANKFEIKFVGSERPQRLVVASRRVRLPGRLAAAAHPQQRGGVRLGAGGRRNDARARRARNRDRSRAWRSRDGMGLRPALRGPLARGAAARRRFEHGPGARAGARPPGLAGDELAQRGRRVARVARARLRPRARVWRPRDRLGGPRRRPRLRSAVLRRRRLVEGARGRDPGRGRTQLRLPAGRRLLAASAAVPARASCRRRPARDPPARCATVRLLALARGVLPRRRCVRAARTSPSLAAPRAVVLDACGHCGRDHRGDLERGGPVRARSRQLLAGAVPARGRRADHVGGRARSRSRSRKACCRSRRPRGAAAI